MALLRASQQMLSRNVGLGAWLQPGMQLINRSLSAQAEPVDEEEQGVCGYRYQVTIGDV